MRAPNALDVDVRFLKTILEAAVCHTGFQYGTDNRYNMQFVQNGQAHQCHV